MEEVSLHAGTRRGRQSLLALVGANYKEGVQSQIRREYNKADMPARSKRLMENSVVSKPLSGFSRNHVTYIAKNQSEAQQEYEAVAEATKLLQDDNSRNANYPPIYGSGVTSL